MDISMGILCLKDAVLVMGRCYSHGIIAACKVVAKEYPDRCTRVVRGVLCRQEDGKS